MKNFLFHRLWLPAVALAAFCTHTPIYSAIQETGAPKPVPASPEIPPPEPA